MCARNVCFAYNPTGTPLQDQLMALKLVIYIHKTPAPLKKIWRLDYAKRNLRLPSNK
jgi:hypothetical protein